MRFSRNDRPLRLAQQREALQHVGHVVDRTRPHLLGVVLEAPFPVLLAVDLPVAEQLEEPIHFPSSMARRKPTPSTFETGTSTVVSLAAMRRW